MGAIAAISAAVIAAGGTTYSIVQANKQKQEAQANADKNAKVQEANADREKAQELQAQNQKQVSLAAAQSDQDAKNNSGFRSTINTTPSGLTGVAVTGGTKTLLGS